MIRNLINVGIVILLSTILLTSQDKNLHLEDVVVVEVGKEKITSKDLQKAYQKNLNRKNDNLFALPKDSITDFINLYSNFRLKVIDAYNRKFDKDSDVVNDIKSNRKILSETFFYDKVNTEKWIDYQSEFRKKEYLIRVVLIPIQYSPSLDTARAWKKINEAMEELRKGAPFDYVSKEYSEDPELAKNGGLIPNYITAGRVQRPIEQAFFKTPKGSFYPEIVRTNFGYFIVKVDDIADRVLVDASQILISINEMRDSATAQKKADSLMMLLKKGANYDKLARENSDDANSAQNGGSLGDLYSRSTGLQNTNYPLLPEFEKALFKLKDGEMTMVKSDYGYHIIKRNATHKPDIEREKSDLRKVYKRLYYDDDKKVLFDSLKRINNFKINEPVLENLISKLDTTQTTIKEKWDENIDNKLYKEKLYSVLGTDYNVEYFVDKLNNQHDLKATSTHRDGLTNAINVLVEPILFEKATENLERDYPDFAELMREFRDGIMLFKVEAIEVWDKLKFDSTQARRYFDTMSQKYYTDDMYDITEVFLLNDSAAQSIYDRIKKGENIKAIAQKETQRDGFRERLGSFGLVSAKTNLMASMAHEQNAKAGDVLKPFKSGTGYSVIKVESHEKPRPKRFEEAIPDIAPMYQDQLQKTLTKNWLQRIKSTVPVKINEKNLNTLINKYKK